MDRDREDLRSILKETGFDLWTLIDTAISVAASDHGAELRDRRDGFVERLYAPPLPQNREPSPQIEDSEEEKPRSRPRVEEQKGSSSPFEKVLGSSPLTPQSNHRQEIDEEEIEEEEEEEDVEPLDMVDRDKRRILAIKEALEDPDQSDDGFAGLLQDLDDMDINFKVLQETDIGRHVNGLRKHQSAEVRRLVKQLVRKWKEIVDEWVKASGISSPAITTDGDSPQQIPAAKRSQNGHRVPDFAYSPNPQNGRMSSNSNYRSSSETAETKPKAIVLKREAPKMKEKESLLDAQRLANARKRLQDNYQEAQNAKKQRKIQVMDINEIPRPKNSFMARNKGGPQHQGRHW